MSEPALIAVLLVWVPIGLFAVSWASKEYAETKSDFTDISYAVECK